MVEHLPGLIAEMAGNVHHHVNLLFRHAVASEPFKLAEPFLGMIGRNIGGELHHRQGDTI